MGPTPPDRVYQALAPTDSDEARATTRPRILIVGPRRNVSTKASGCEEAALAS